MYQKRERKVYHPLRGYMVAFSDTHADESPPQQLENCLDLTCQKPWLFFANPEVARSESVPQVGLADKFLEVFRNDQPETVRVCIPDEVGG